MSVARAAAVSLLLALSGCDGTTLDFFLDRQFTVDIPAGNVTTYSETKSVDLKEVNARQVVGAVKEILVPEIWVEVSNVSGAAAGTTFSGTVAVGATQDGEFITLADFKDIPVAEGGKTELLLDSAAQSRAQPILLGRDTAFVKYTATASAVPVKFDAKARIHLQAVIGL